MIKNNQATDGKAFVGFYILGSGNTLDSNISNNNNDGFEFSGHSQNNLISRFILTTVGRVVMNHTIIDSVSTT